MPHDDAGLPTRPLDDPQGDLDAAESGFVGRYRLLHVLGEGGMGVVWLAAQRSPIKRRVALKVIKAGMDSKSVLGRFEAERQALALMDHPSIATVLDAGTTSHGRPYFVMEYVQGISTHEYCDLHRVPMRERIKLFIQLCDAVQHAHQKGIIHRDLKPSNVMVTVRDGRPVPKVIDFGIAKAMTHDLTARTLQTQAGQMIGTPAYMSPEQAEMTGLDVDTRTDVYALGVMLYELLVGELPFDFTGVGQPQVAAILRHKDAPTPSACFDTLGERKREVAARRGTTPPLLRSRLKGDLDWIVMKALEKDRTRRYATVNGLALDLQRHLDHAPVTAGSPSLTYRTTKFVRRHRIGVAAGGAVTLALVLGSSFATLGMLRAKRAERVAEAEASTATAINHFLQQTLGSASPWRGGRGRDATILEVLDFAVLDLDRSLADQTLVAAEVRSTIGYTYLRLGEYERAEPLLMAALAAHEEFLSAPHQDLARSLKNVGLLYLNTGRIEEAEELIAESLRMNRTLRGADDPESIEVLADYALVLIDLARFDDAVRLQREVLERRRRVFGDEHLEVALGLNDLGLALGQQGHIDESIEILSASVALYRALLETRSGREAELENFLALALSNLAARIDDQGRLDEAEALLQEALDLNRRVFGDENVRIASTWQHLSAVAAAKGDMDRAVGLSQEALDLRSTIFGPVSPEVAGDLSYLGGALAEAGQLDSAEVVERRAVDIYARLEPEGRVRPAWHVVAVNNLGVTLATKGDCMEAVRLFEEAVRRYRAIHGAGHANTANSLSHLGNCLMDLGRYDDAEKALMDAIAILETERPEDHPWTTRTRERLARLDRIRGAAPSSP